MTYKFVDGPLTGSTVESPSKLNKNTMITMVANQDLNIGYNYIADDEDAFYFVEEIKMHYGDKHDKRK